jgi:murein DD-endopeptidase MepM/ murein hydrolase activator NlpD
VGERRLGRALLAIVMAFVALALAPPDPAFSQGPRRALAQGDDSPFPLTAPWPAGQVWMAGNGGNYYGDGAHLGAEQFAVDFNRVGAEDNGQPISAAADGVVVSAGWLNGYGNSVIVAHRYGVRTMYGHLLLPPSVIVGQRVTTATVLGFCGSTGNSTGPHLHFSVRRGTTSLKPEPMEKRSLTDGILLVAGPKPAPVEEAPLLADLARSPAAQPAGGQAPAVGAQDIILAAGAGAPRDEARGGRQGRAWASLARKQRR